MSAATAIGLLGSAQPARAAWDPVEFVKKCSAEELTVIGAIAVALLLGILAICKDMSRRRRMRDPYRPLD
jgi:hypothetical protein